MKRTPANEFVKGGESALASVNPENTRKAVEAVAKRTTPPLVRAYWTGYLCTAQQLHGEVIPASEPFEWTGKI